MSGRVYCISGGAGVGKTTVLRMLAQMIVSLQGTACFMSISGGTTRHIAEALGPELANRCTVKTVTCYLHFTARDLPSDSSPWLIVDEASVLDLQNAYRIISRSPQNSRLILVGNPDQLPPVGPGLVFHALTLACDQEWLRKKGFSIGPEGSVQWRTRRGVVETVLPLGFLSGLRKLIA
jgi:exodeoxyribonuclease V alpha subunit